MLHALFLLIYLALFALLLSLLRLSGAAWPSHVSGLDFLLLCFATFRLTHLLTEERIARCIRAPFVVRKTITNPDGTRKEEEEPVGHGLRRVIGELLICPWCSGVWIATLLTFFHVLVPRTAHIFLLALATAAGAILIETIAKLFDRARASLGG